MEKKLLREGNLPAVNQEFDKILRMGKIVQLTQEEMDAWDGAVHYVCY